MNQYLHNKTFQNLSTLCAKRLKKRSRQSFPPLWEISHIALFEFTLCFMSMTSYPLFCPTRHRGLGLKFARWKPSQTIRTRVFTLHLRAQTGYHALTFLPCYLLVLDSFMRGISSIEVNNFLSVYQLLQVSLVLCVIKIYL